MEGGEGGMERLLGTTLYNTSFQELSLSGGRWQSGGWAHWCFKMKIVFLLEKAVSSTLSHVHTLTLTPISTCTHLHVPPAYLTMLSYHTYVHIQMSL